MAKSAAIERALDRADPDIRCYLLYGPDDSGSRALAARLAKALGPDAERIDFDSSRVKADPAILADEASSGSLFGGARYIVVEGAGDDCLAAVEALLEVSAAGNPVILLAGALKKDAKLVKRLAADPAAMLFASYVPEGAEADRMAIDMGRAEGLRIDSDLARRLIDATGGDRAILAGEIEKLVLYATASPESPKAADHAMLDRIGVDAGEADLSRLVDAVMGGRDSDLGSELIRLSEDGQEGITLIRAVLRRLVAMAQARADVDRGTSPQTAVDKIGRTLFWKEKDAIARDLRRWTSARIATAIERLAATERQLKSSGGPGTVAADAELFAIARAARSR